MRILDENQLERVLKLMKEYKIDEFQSEEFTIKKSIHQSAIIPLTPEQIIDKHTAAPEQEPWETVPDSALQEFAIRGKI